MKRKTKSRHAVPRREQRPRANVVARRRYCTARWGRLREYVLARDNWICRSCGEFGNEVDHIEPWSKDDRLFWKQDNLQVLCKTCHSRKTMKETLQ